MIKLIILVVLVLMLGWMISTLESRTLYFPDRTLIQTPALYQIPFEDVRLTTKDHVSIHGWFLPGTGKKTILFSHGNAGNISHRIEKIKRMRETGASILLYDYRGFGASEGKPSEAGTYADAEAAYASLIARGIKPNDIVFYGESLGCAVALEMAVRHGGAGVILESPFTSTVAMGKIVFPWLPVQWIVRYKYDNLAKIKNLKVPLLIMHSPRDEIVPFAMGKALYEGAPQPKRFFELRGDHNSGYEITGLAYARAMITFIKGLPHD